MSIYRMKSFIPVLYSNMRPREGITLEDFRLAIAQKQFDVLKILGVLLMETKFTSEASKIYMQYPDASQDLVATRLNALSINTIKGKIRHDSQKLKDMFDGDILDFILKCTNEVELEKLAVALSDKINSYPRIVDSSKQLFTVQLPKAKAVYSWEVTDDEFELIKAAASRLSIKTAEGVIEKIGDKGVGYIQFLLDREPIDTVDIKRRRELLSMVK